MPNSIRRWNGSGWGTVYSDILDTLTTVGDIAYRASTGLMTRLGVPTSYTSQVLGASGGVPAWVESDPAGTLRQTIKTTADPGWLLMNGQSIAGADVAYPVLFSLAPAGWKSSTTLTLPDMANRMTIGAGTNTALGVSGGNTAAAMAAKTLILTDIPNHGHTVTTGITTNAALGALSSTVSSSSGSGYTGFVANGAAGANALIPTTGSGYVLATASVSTTGSIATQAVYSSTASTTSVTGHGGAANTPGTSINITPAVLGIVWQIKAH